MRDRYNLNLLPGMSEDGVEYGECVCVCDSQRDWKVCGLWVDGG